MPDKPIKSVRGLARALGISHTTVSDALRNSPRVCKKTRERVQKAAREAGYHYNPLAGALMSEMRRSGVGTFRGVTAIVDLESEDVREPSSPQYHREITHGAKEAAKRLGFNVDLFILGKENLSIARLGKILESRGIRGMLILPASGKPDLSDLDWDKFAGIYTDYIIDNPPLHSVCSDHFRSMFVAMRKVADLGYSRPGLVLHDAHDRRLLFRWEAAFRTFTQHYTEAEVTEPFITHKLTREGFLRWFRETAPDVVMCHRQEVLEWILAEGLKVPEDCGFCCLNVTMSSHEAAGLDLQPRLIGSRGMESLIAQLHRNEYGVPETPSTITIPAVWRMGPTLAVRGKPVAAMH